MMAMARATMGDEAPNGGGQIGRIVLLAAATLGAIFGVGIVAGILIGHADHGGPLTGLLIAIIAGSALLALGSFLLARRQMRAIAEASGAPTARERRNRNVLIVCGALGGVMGAMLSLLGPTPFSAFTNDPLPAWFALALTAVTVLLIPALSYYWHKRVVDEQEAAAYSKGALLGLYVFWIGAPAWWFLWRGGLVPAPNGIIIYFATVAVAGAIWMWGKYR
jgi:hypothetical protein